MKRGALIHDARIAACCLTGGVGELWTVDRDFSRFPALKTRNPLITLARVASSEYPALEEAVRGNPPG